MRCSAWRLISDVKVLTAKATVRQNTLLIDTVCDFRAADEYIVRYFSKSAGNCKVLRVYNKKRRASTVSSDVVKFCLVKDGCFVDPCRRDILESKIILTTMVTSLQLTELELQGCFTHILIDEAAQVHSTTVLLF